MSDGRRRGAFCVAQRQSPSRDEDGGKLGRCPPFELGMRPPLVVIGSPDAQHCPGMRQGREQRLVEQFIAEAPVEAFDEGILRGLAGSDVMPFDSSLVGPISDSVRGKFSAVAPQEG